MDDINDQGDIVGLAQTDTDQLHVALWKNGGAPLDLGKGGGFNFVPHAIGDGGRIAGAASAQAAILKNGTVTLLGGLGLPNAVAWGVNALGEVVGGASGDVGSGSSTADSSTCRPPLTRPAPRECMI